MAPIVGTTESLVAHEVPAVLPAAPHAAVGNPAWSAYFTIDRWTALFGMAGKIAFLGGVAFVGAVAGYLVKRYAKAIVTIAIGSLCVGAACEFFGFITIHWEMFNQALAGGVGQSLSGVMTHLMLLVKKNAFVYAAGLIGFIIGHMLGHARDE